MEKRLTTLLLLLAFTANVATYGQDVSDTVQYRFSYAMKLKALANQDYYNEDEIRLEVGKKYTRSYSRWREGNLLITDSVMRHGGSSSDILNAVQTRGFHHPNFDFEVWGNYPAGGKRTVVWHQIQKQYYEEDHLPQEWTPAEGDTVILGYNCMKAHASFRGRGWTAWYAVDIPISLGPWKLSGLPGIIMKAEDDRHDFMFECIGIDASCREPIVLRNKRMIKTTPQKIQQMLTGMGDDPSLTFGMLGMDAKMATPNGRPVSMPSATPCLIEFFVRE